MSIFGGGSVIDQTLKGFAAAQRAASGTSTIVHTDGGPTTGTTYPGSTGSPYLEAKDTAEDKERARQLRNALTAQAYDTKPRAAPQVGAPQQVIAGNTVAPTLGPMERPQAVMAGSPQQVYANTVHAAQISPIERVRAAQIAATQNANAITANTAQIALGPQDQLRQQQMDLFGGLTAAANGTGGPSAAQMQMQRGIDAAIAAQHAQAAQAHGTGVVTAGLQAANNIGDITQRSAADSAILRANEQQAARAQLLAGLQGARTSDIGLATSQAGLEETTNVTNAQLGTSVNLANVNAANVRSLNQAQLEQSAAMGNAAAQNELSRQQAVLQQQASLANQDASLRAGIANQGATLQTSLANAGFSNQANIVGATEANKGTLAGADMALRAGLSNAQLGQQASLSNAQLGQQAGIANAGFSQSQMSVDDARRQAALQSALSAQGQVLGVNSNEEQARIAREGLANAKTASERSFWSQMLGTALTVGGAIGGAIITGGNPAGAVAGGAAGSAVGSTLANAD